MWNQTNRINGFSKEIVDYSQKWGMQIEYDTFNEKINFTVKFIYISFCFEKLYELKDWRIDQLMKMASQWF